MQDFSGASKTSALHQTTDSFPWRDTAASLLNKKARFIDHNYDKKKVAAHAFLFCKSSALLFGHIPMKYGVMMQLRFDGTLGFPGGLIEKDEEPVTGLNRELHEEIGLEEKYYFKEENYFRSWVTPNLVDHFYVKKYSETDFLAIEATVLKGKDWGGETLGMMRVPVQDIKGKHAKHHPLVSFFCHKFIANAREELIETLLNEDIVTHSQMLEYWSSVEALKRT